MSKGKRYENEPKLNIKKVIGAIVAMAVIIMIIISVGKLIFNNNENGKLSSKNYFTICENERWGVINSNGEVVIQPIYEEMIVVPNQSKPVFLCVSSINDETGEYTTRVIDENNKEIFKEYEKVEALDNYENTADIWYEDNALRVKQNGKYGLINFKGEKLLNCEYDEITTLKGVTNSLLVRKDNKVGIVNTVGQIIVKPEYKNILKLGQDYRNGYIVVNEENKYGIVSINEAKILETEYDEVKYINSSEMYAAKKDGKWKLIGKDNSVILEEGFTEIVEANFENIVAKKDSKYGVITKTGEEKIPYQYDYLEYISNENYIAKKDNKYGVINLSNTEILKFEYISMIYREDADFIEAQKVETETIVYTSKLEEKFVGTVCQVNVEKGFIKARINNEYKYFNLKFEEKTNIDLLTSNNLFLSKKDGKYGYVNKSGNVVVDYIYDDATEQNKYGYCAVKKDGVWGCLDKIGKEIVTPSINLDNSIFTDFIGQWHLEDNGVYYIK